MPAAAIPIENIYYLLCYAWDSLAEAAVVPVSFDSRMTLVDLLGRVLRGGVAHILKRGLDRSYVTHNEELAGIRGRLDFDASLNRVSFPCARAVCTFDELSPNVLHNRIVKTSLRSLAAVRGIDGHLAEDLRALYRHMPGVEEVRLTGSAFRRVALNRNSRFYRFPLDVCETVYRNLLVDERTGETRFRDFSRDDREMASLFEKFLRNFYHREHKQYKVSAPRFAWSAIGTAEDVAYLPQMRTDLVLEKGNSVIVIDAKYYSNALQEHMSKRTVRSSHLYQLFSYMQHVASASPGCRVGGMLIYPRTTETVRVRLELFGHPFTAATINLAQPWQGVRSDLLGLLPAANEN